jgi:hypothetical protein
MFLLLLQETKTITKTVVTYNTEVTTVVAVLVLAWIGWLVLSRFLRSRNMRRRSLRKDKRLNDIRKIKGELSSNWLRKEKSKNIHAIGIGKLADGEPCIQIFIENSNDSEFEDPSEFIPRRYRNIALVLIEMPQAVFLSTSPTYINFSAEEYRALVRDKQEVIMGGISGANSNLNGQCGTIGYFVRRKSFLPRKGDVCLLSNSHVFVDLKKGMVDEDDLIMQPSPGEPADSCPIGGLLDFTRIKFDTETDEANQVDAAVAKLWKQQEYQLLIPMIGMVKGFVKKDDVQVGEVARKVGRTTGFTRGHIFSIHLDIRIRYEHTGEDALFTEQFLIKPDETQSPKFVQKGDSGSLVVDEKNYTMGLIFAGADGGVVLRELGEETITPNRAMLVEQIKNCGVANPISEVLAKLKLELL